MAGETKTKAASRKEAQGLRVERVWTTEGSTPTTR